MNRRAFISTLGVGAASAATVGPAVSAVGTTDALAATGTPKKLKMHVGTQRGVGWRRRRRDGTEISEAERTQMQISRLQYLRRCGIEHACGYPPRPGERGYWSVEDLEKTRDLYEKNGISLDMVALPLLASSHIDRTRHPAIMLGQSPERDRDIEHINIMTATCARAGIPAWKYNMSLLGVLRQRRDPVIGRGGARHTRWRLADAVPDPELTKAGVVTEEMAWERITYFLERVIPVCEEYKVRAACHPHDPGVPAAGYQGVVRVLGTFEGLKKFISIRESAYHGLNLCLGTMSENLQNPAEEIHDVIRYFGTRKKLFNIHFRNIKGHRNDFHEAFIDDGDLDMLQVARTLAEVDYPYMLMPDHVPRHEDDRGGLQAYAFAFGYIKAILHAVETYG